MTCRRHKYEGASYCVQCKNGNQERVNKRIKMGMCVQHPYTPALKGQQRCQRCADKYESLRLLGKCPSHPNKKSVPGTKRCDECFDKENNRRAVARAAGMCTVHTNERAASGKRVCQKCLDYRKKKTEELRKEVMAAYGGRCQCLGDCKESIIDFLTIDHIFNDGAAHKKIVGTGWHLYRWLKQNNFPKDRYRILCYNCNCSKKLGKCYHERNI